MLLIYPITLFVNAALLFIVEPMVAKMILPLMGGTPAVWNMSLLFFQACLLGGYLYAHCASIWFGTMRHALIHLIVLVSALLFLPISIPVHWFAVPGRDPATLVLSVLFVSIGFPFFVLAAGGPLLQKWFAQSQHSAAGDPYFLYAASNLGSIVGLVAYPVFWESNFTLAEQNRFWLYGYLTLLVLTSGCALLSLRSLTSMTNRKRREGENPGKTGSLAVPNRGAVTLVRRLRWLVLSFVPSSLLLGVTLHVTTDVVSAPLFWILPLALYLVSFVFAFASRSWAAHPFVVRRQAFLLLGTALTVFVRATTPVLIVLPLHLLSFFVTALVCHGELAKDRPEPRYLTEFYLWNSIGGVLGGLFNALLAPLVFKGVLEYPLAMIVAAFIRPYVGEKRDTPLNRCLDFLLPAVLGLFAVVIVLGSKNATFLSPYNAYLLIFGVSGVVCLSFSYRPMRFGLGLAAVMFASTLFTGPFGEVLHADRSFFGVYRTMVDNSGKNHLLFHGTTVHGAQSVDAQRRLQPNSYYHRTGPAGQVFNILANTQGEGNVAVVGLGTGTLACYGTQGQKFTFYEIDPLVEQIARDPKLFTYLRDCPPKSEVVIGDARISLGNAPNNHYHLLILDAFSSDVIPTHLLTQEAMKLYVSKIAPDGILLFHISNRYMDLAPVLDRLASTLKLVALIQADSRVTEAQREEGKSPSRWVIMARQKEILSLLLADPRWRLLDGRLGGDLWTDDYSDVLRVIYWR